MPVAVQSKAELVFEDYLARHGIIWEYETLAGLKKPDYVIPHAAGKCIVEVKQIEDPNPRPTKGYNPDRSVRAKIKSARKQLGEYKEHPCSLAVYSESMFGPYEPSIILSAAFGPGYTQAGRDYGKIDPSPSFYRFCNRSELPTDMHFLAKAMLSPVANRTFSALIMLSCYEINELHLNVWKRLYAIQEAGQPISNNDQFRLLEELGPELALERRYAGTVRVIVVENRHANVPFPEDLFRGPFDQRWGWRDEWCGPAWIGSELESLVGEGVPFHML
jgi:hypothetical protein